MTPDRLAELEAIRRALDGTQATCDAYDDALHNSATELFALASEALARREGATAFQAIYAGLAREALSVTLHASGGRFMAFLYWDGRQLTCSGWHETEVAAVQAAIAERNKQ